MEVLSPATRDRDLTSKKRLFQNESVSWYLIIDPDANTLQPLRLNSAREYGPAEAREVLDVYLCDDCNLSARIDRLFS